MNIVAIIRKSKAAEDCRSPGRFASQSACNNAPASWTAAVLCRFPLSAISFIALFIWLLSGSADAATVPFRPVPGKGAATKTLLLYTDTHSAYSLLDSLELLKLQLGRIATTVEPLPLSQFDSNKIDAADYLIVLSPQPGPLLASNVAAAIRLARAPTLWVGFGVDALQPALPSKAQTETVPAPVVRAAHAINYREKEWDIGQFSYIESQPPTNATAILTAIAITETNTIIAPVCWKAGSLTYFGSEPQAGPFGFLFEDILLDFFGVKEVPSPCFLLRMTGYSPQSNHREFKRMADFLHSRSLPFAVSVTGLSQDLTQSEAGLNFVESLRYAQQRGARLVLQGAREMDSGPEFWDTSADRPLSGLTAQSVRQRVTSAAEVALNSGLLPIAWQTPQYVASSQAYAEIAKIFSTAIERVQISDTTARQNYAPGGLSIDRYRRLIIPENLGFVANGSNGLSVIQVRADLLTQLRGTLLGCSIDAFHPLPKLIELVALLETYHLSFVDLADLGNRVQLPDAVLLTGDAVANVHLRDATLRWKTFNRAGQLLAEDEQRTKVSGQRELKRIGIGVFELIRFKGATDNQK